MVRCTLFAVVNARWTTSNKKLLVLEPQWIKSTTRAKRLLIPPVYSLRGICAYDELQIVVTEVGQVKQTVTSFVDKGFLERTFAKRVGELLKLSKSQIRMLAGPITNHCHLEGNLFKLGWKTVPRLTDAKVHLKWPHMFYVIGEALVAFWFRHLGHFLKLGDFTNILTTLF